jgi:SAM-dependent methyltransferase
MVDVDFGRTASDYVQYRTGFPEGIYEELSARGIGVRGQRVLDIGTGTGTMAREFARRGCEVVGLDPSEELIAEARRIDAEQDLRIEYVIGTAERTRLDARSFDVVSAGQCWYWLDRPKAVREIKRVLRPEGLLVIAQFDWIPLPGNAVEATEELIEKYNPEWRLGGGTGLHYEWMRDVRAAGLEDIRTLSFDQNVVFSHEAWRGRVRASAGVRASMSPDMVARFDENLRAMLVERFTEDPLALPHCAWVMHARLPAG